MLRTSSYTIYVDLPGNNEEMLLVHGYSGAYDKVSRRVATYVRSLEISKPPRPLYGEWSPMPQIEGYISLPSDETIGVLKRRGYLTEMSVEEETAFFSKISNQLHAYNSRPNYIFMPTYDCNLRCSYCFQDHMRTNPHYKHLLRTMRRDVVDRIFAAMPQIEAHHGLPPGPAWRSSIGFFGGEPLLERSRPIVEYIIDKALAQCETMFWAITNGCELHAYRDLLGPGKISWLQITLDGPPREHDRRRVHADGSGSFEQIAQNITMVLEQGVQVSVRMNIDRNNIDQLPELAEEIIARKWNTYPAFHAYTAPINAANDHTEAKTTFSTWELDQALNALRVECPQMEIINRPDDGLVNKAQNLFKKQNRPSLNSTFCSAHSGMYLFDLFGDIYACWERTGDPHIRIGSIAADGTFLLQEQLNNQWRSRNVTTNPICRKCRYALYCGGGCAVLAESERGAFFTNHCDGFAARFRASVAEAYQNHVIGLEPLLRTDPGCDH